MRNYNVFNIADIPAIINTPEKPYTITCSKFNVFPERVGATHTIIKIPTIMARIPPIGVKSSKLPCAFV